MNLYADATIFKTIESVDDIDLIQEDAVLEWSDTWQLPLKVKKCKDIHYGKDNPNHTYEMGDAHLVSDDREKDVGVIFDPSLEFKIHIKPMIDKANSRVGMIKRSFFHLDSDNLKLLCKPLLRPILEYCSSI